MTFNQQGQQVGTQYNAERDMHFGGQARSENLPMLLEELKQQLVQAHKQGILDEDASTDAEYHVTKALQQVQKPQPDKKSILAYLVKAQKLVDGVASASALTASIVHLVEMVQRLF